MSYALHLLPISLVGRIGPVPLLPNPLPGSPGEFYSRFLVWGEAPHPRELLLVDPSWRSDLSVSLSMP